MPPYLGPLSLRHVQKIVILSGAARLYLPRRILARRAAQSKDPSPSSPCPECVKFATRCISPLHPANRDANNKTNIPTTIL
jgi:hypothetical protein